ncbi:unnamed protein product [Allacma fusca]|uniref:Uncharacterized protein n=1 Tax=Allacma fusca TaxID=39272 RepID=A0A8J2JIY0_9HEXA|nr:unnamed protein product [Allacma fusca]
MDTKIIYAAAAANSLDSWDFENLRYIRKISRGRPPGSGDLDTVSYISEQNEDLDSIALPCLESETEPELPDNGFLLPHLENSIKSDTISCADSSAGVGLDDCYLLDVVTVRNESVLAFSPHQYPSDKHSAGSSSTPSSSSSSSGLNELDMRMRRPDNQMMKERDFFDLSLDMDSLQTKPDYSCKDEFQLYQRHSPCSMESQPMSTVTTIFSKENQRRNPIRAMAHCPFCDQHNPFVNQEQSVNLEDISMQVTVGGELPAAPPRSPSPYYIRLRRDLLAAITPQQNTLKINRPRNFSVNPQGQLEIDYSSNWLGLENYVKNRKR